MTSPRVSRRPGFGLRGLVVTCIGAGLLLVAFLVLDWFEGVDPLVPPDRDGISPTTRLTLREAYVASEQSRLGALVHAYVAWLGWALVLVVVLAAIAASLPGSRSRQWRVVGVTAGVGAAVATYFACQFNFTADPDRRLHVDAHAGFGDARLGAKVALAGFLLCAIGAALGPLGARAAEAGAASRAATSGKTRRVASIVTLAVGATLLVLAFDHSSWYHTDRYDADPQISFGDLINNGDGRVISRISVAFFPTLAWLLLVSAVVVVVFACLRTALTPLLRAVGVAIGLSGVVLTYVALARQFSVTYNPTTTHGERGVFLGAQPGLWFAFAGYLLCAAAAAIAPPAPTDTSSATTAPAEPLEPKDAGDVSAADST